MQSAVAQLVEGLTRDRLETGLSLTSSHYVMSLSKTLYPLLYTGSTQKYQYRHD